MSRLLFHCIFYDQLQLLVNLCVKHGFNGINGSTATIQGKWTR
eukprot:COSAG06_NODE_2724_length_6384_cov_81.190135_6_plen_43_part_00